MRAAPPLIAIAFCAALSSVAAAQDARPASGGKGQYFVDFRARGGGVLGHTFVVYGRIEGGRITEQHHAGLNPDDAYSDKPLLVVMLVPGHITKKHEDPKKPITANYRRKLTAAEYAHLKLTVQRLHQSSRQWHMTFYNCNDFAAQVARELGMVAPLTWMLPPTFVNHLAAMNGP